ncbi:MAG: AraC family transcriptional regulator [Phycisphaeraceae bacterium]
MPENDQPARHRQPAPKPRRGGAKAAAGVLRYAYGGAAAYLPGEKFGPRTMVDFEFVWIMAGDVVYRAGDQQYDAPQGSVILSRPGFTELYEWDRRQTTRHAYFHFGLDRVPRDFPPVKQWPVCLQPAQGDPLRPLFRQVVETWCSRADRARPPVHVSRLVETMLSLFVMPAQRAAALDTAALPQPLERALRCVNQSFEAAPHRPLSLEELSRQAAVTPKHLCRLFAQYLNASPMQVVRMLRLERSTAYLARSNLSVKQIAARCGFASPYHFSRSFKAAYGASPTDVRQQTRQGAPPPSNLLPITRCLSEPPGMAEMERKT